MVSQIDRRTLLTASGAFLLTSACAAGIGRATYPLIRRGDRLFVGARINGSSVEALFDSAAELTVIDKAFADRIGLGKGKQTSAHGTGAQSVDADLIPHVRIEAAGVAVPNATVAAIDLSDIAQRLLNRPLAMVLGRQIFDASALLIDIAGGSWRKWDPNETARGVELPLTTDRGIELMPVSVEGVPTLATFDLGNGSGVLVSRAFAQAHLLDGRAIGKKVGGGIGGGHVRDTLVLRSIELAGRTFWNVAASIDDTENASPVNVGVGLLSQFRIIADYPGHRLWLEPEQP